MSPLKALSLSALVLCTVSSALAASTTQPLPLPVPPQVSAATLLGRLPAATSLNLSISIQPSSRAAFTAYAASVSNPKSPNFHHFLSPAQIGQRFGASTTTVNTVVSYLKSKGMTVTMVADNHMAVLFKGRADKVESAFGTKLNRYRLANDNGRGPREFFSYTTPPSLPKTFAPKVVSVGGLQNATRPIGRSTLTPAQARQLYNAAALYAASSEKGSGINVGITNFDGYRLSNLSKFYPEFGLPTPAGGVGTNIVKVSVDGGDGESVGAAGEGDLDIQMVVSQAPLARVYIYDAVNNYDLVALLARQANDDLVDIVTESYGHYTGSSSDPNIIAAHDQHLALTAQGVTYLCASGDYGTDLTAGSGYSYDYPDFDPELTIVGGSVATVSGSGTRIDEVGWVGSGSGWSTYNYDFNVRPSWQVGDTVPTNINRRLFPDVAVHAHGANKTFAESTLFSDFAYYVVMDGQDTVSSGTSASSPQFAGQLAMILEGLKNAGAADVTPSGRFRLGRINDFIYGLNGDPSAFFDLISGDSGPLPDGTEAIAKPGWDYVTGWGAPNDEGLYTAFLSNGSTPLEDSATAAGVFATSTPAITFGTLVEGDVTALPTADGITYSAQSVRQAGVGQVAAVTVDFALSGDEAKRRSAAATVSFSSPNLTTGFVYLYNYTTGNYDVVKTVTGSGATKTVNITSIDLSSYVQNNALRVLVRAMKPTRLGSTPFRLAVDRVVVVERIAAG